MLLTSCKPEWYCKRCNIDTTDSVITLIEYRDSIIVTSELHTEIIKIPAPQDSLLMRALVECDSNFKAQMSYYVFANKNLKVQLRIKDGVLEENIQTTFDSLTHEIEHKTQIIEKLHSEISTHKEKKVIKVPKLYIPWYTKVLAVIGGISLILLLIIVLFNIFVRR